MVNGDFTDDPWGNNISGTSGAGFVPTIVNPNMIGASTSLTAYPNEYFQCNSSGTPLAANSEGLQPQGINCNRIPSNLISSIGQGLMKLYPSVTPSTLAGSASLGYN